MSKQTELAQLGDAVTVDGSGGVTITTSGSGDALTITSTDAGDTFAPDINFYRNSSSPADNDGTGLINFKGRNDNSQDVNYVQIQTAASDVSDGSENGYFAINTMVDGSLSDRLIIDASGNLLVGKSSAAYNTDGFEARPNGETYVSRTGTPMAINRNSSDGVLLNLYKDGSGVGSIGTHGNDINIQSTQSGKTGIQFGTRWLPMRYGGLSDNTVDCGHPSYRFDDIYATNGTIQTSDRNEKQDIEELTDAEKRVAVAAKGLLRKFRWKSAVAEKGDEARTHFGIIAQDLQAAFAAEGLDAGDYAMFISSTWTDEETGEERTRLGVRYSELLAFIIGAL